jgi:hypothetical protein
MTAVDFVRTELARVHRALDASLTDITDDQLHAVPGGHPEVNTIAWNVFHCVRTEDNVVRFVLQNRRPTVWAEGGYAERLGLPPVAQGTGMSSAEAQALRVKDVAVFREYMQRAWASTDDLFARAEPGFFEKTVTVKPLGDMPALRALGQICLGHTLMHVGQIEMARTLVGARPVIGV